MGAPEPVGWRDGLPGESRLNNPGGLWLDEPRNVVYLADTRNHVIRALDTETGETRTIAGLPEVSGLQDGIFDEAQFDQPNDLWATSDGQWLFVADEGNATIRRIDTESGEVTTLQGDDDLGVPTAVFGHEMSDGTLRLYVADIDNDLILTFDLSSPEANQGSVSLLAGGGDPDVLDPADPIAQDGVGAMATFDSPTDVAFDAASDRLYVIESGHHLLRAIDVTTNRVTTVAGDRGVNDAFDGVGTDATFNRPYQLALTPDASFALVADLSNHAIRAVELSTGRVTTIVGDLGISGGFGSREIALSDARLYFAAGVAAGQDDLWLSADEAVMTVPGEIQRSSQW
jgi:DNA-binding beta-propeller fold protein YncE